MRALFYSIIFLCNFLNASDLKILKAIPFGTYNLKIVFNKSVKKDDFVIKRIDKNKIIMEVEATLIPYSKKVFNFPGKNQIVIGQNTPKIVRIVLVNYGKKEYSTNFFDQNLYIKLQDKTDMQQEVGTKKNIVRPVNKSKPPTQSVSNNVSPRKYRVVIDPGHGGKDCGAMAVNKICEKTIVLDVAKLVKKKLDAKNYQVFMTRNSDVYVDLRARTDMANAKNADLFISIHANSVAKTGNIHSQGVETYFLSTARSERALDVAEQENKGDVETMSYFSKLSFLNTLNSHRLIASNKLAIDIQIGILRELKRTHNNVTDGGVREGPFWVLAGALMPSVLIEIGYVSNAIEGRKLSTKEYQESLANGIVNGIDSFVAKNF
ncbi:N-acetylmuramoyl-L-alanine amidase [Helicobacter sp. faydin-H20]|uniref:N-acetylmuramoyl-L-alanine amidase family protein n=1 Tax=Helicobacter anatolicus TaxID=2905874 RepID=UPI001E3F9369|nr:N-acetylmuramoyl-L-alanine amidase [Helicobacter anatolicus]MCE3036347.1 N-acetylmuramoyl-L-alanine amidase [Helicobacter anatolicus]